MKWQLLSEFDFRSSWFLLFAGVFILGELPGLHAGQLCFEVPRALGMRIGILGVPIDLGGRVPGTHLGPAAMREAGLVGRLIEMGADVKDFGDIHVPPRETVAVGNPNARYLDEIIRVNNDLMLEVKNIHEQGYTPGVIAGDHCMFMGSIAGSALYQRGNHDCDGLSVWYFDAHADINTPETSAHRPDPKGNVHGMPVAHAFGLWRPQGLLSSHLPRLIDPKNFFYIGLRDVDDLEWVALRQSGARIYGMKEIRERGMPAITDEMIQHARERNLRVHVSFDLDWHDSSFIQGVGTPVPDGGTIEESRDALQRLQRSRLLYSMDVVEVNPTLDRNGKTVETAVDMAVEALKPAIVPAQRTSPSAF